MSISGGGLRKCVQRPIITQLRNKNIQVPIYLSCSVEFTAQITMSNMKKKKKGADDPPMNNNRSDHKSSKTSSAVISAVNNSNQNKGKGSKGKK
jgi:hypothetical protein